MNGKELILIGGGGHCKAIVDVALSAHRSVMGILDNALEKGSRVLGVSVIGNDNDIKSIVEQYGDDVEFLISVGQIKSAEVRRRISDEIINAGGALATPLISPSAHIAKGAKVGNGTVVMHNAVINADAVVGENCIINTGAIVEHDCAVGNFVHISTGAIMNGVSSIGDNSFVGSHATIANTIKVCANAVIGAGAVVVDHISQSGTYCGVPAKRLTDSNS